MLKLAEETEQLIALVAEKTGKAPATIVHEAVEATARAAGVVQSGSKPSKGELIARMKAIADRSTARPVLDGRTPDEIIGYDEFGVPR
jgi:antitoxin VapB